VDTSSLGVAVVQQAVFVVRQFLAAGVLALLVGLLVTEVLRRADRGRAAVWAVDRLRAIASAFRVAPRFGLRTLHPDLPSTERQ
jgi:hypothetical protein